jgi:Neuraminidase-like domain
VETAAAQYLSDLDDIASMDVRCAYYDVDELVQHVFSRTKGGDPRDYYYRQFQQERTWTPWQKVSLDIKGDHLLAFKRNSRLCLAWPTFTQTPDSNATFPVPTTSSGGSTSTPTSQWQIQLAVSERSGNVWKKKTVSQDVLLYPPDGTFISDLPDADSFLFFVWSIGSNQAINVFYGEEFIGAFNLTGCKGYPEASAVDSVPDVTILPDFANSILQAECFVYNGSDNSRRFSSKLKGLQIRSIFDAFNFDPILREIVGNWIVTYPLQMSLLDWVIVILEIYLSFQGETRRESQIILPLGTAMPYFYGDTAHTFVIIPSLYQVSDNSSTATPITTFSDIYTLLENMILLLSKYLSLYQQDPTHNLQNLLKQLVQDPKYIAIVAELNTWIVLQPGLQFKTFYHPLIVSQFSEFKPG